MSTFFIVSQINTHVRCIDVCKFSLYLESVLFIANPKIGRLRGLSKSSHVIVMLEARLRFLGIACDYDLEML